MLDVLLVERRLPLRRGLGDERPDGDALGSRRGSAGARTPGRRRARTRGGRRAAAGSAAKSGLLHELARGGRGGRLAPLDAARDEVPVAELLRRAEEDEVLEAAARAAGRRRRPRRDAGRRSPPLRAHRGHRRSRRSSGAERCRLTEPSRPPSSAREHGRAGARPRRTARRARDRAGRARPAGRRASRIPAAIASTSSGSTRTAASPQASSSEGCARGDDRRAACHRLDDRHAEPLVERRIHEHRGSTVETRDRPRPGRSRAAGSGDRRGRAGRPTPRRPASTRPSSSSRSRQASTRRARFLRGSIVPRPRIAGPPRSAASPSGPRPSWSPGGAWTMRSGPIPSSSVRSAAVARGVREDDVAGREPRSEPCACASRSCAACTTRGDGAARGRGTPSPARRPVVPGTSTR